MLLITCILMLVVLSGCATPNPRISWCSEKLPHRKILKAEAVYITDIPILRVETERKIHWRERFSRWVQNKPPLTPSERDWKVDLFQ